MYRRSLTAVLLATIVLVACSFGSTAAPHSLHGPLRIDVSGLPVNLVIPLVNDTGFSIYSFCIVLTTESNWWLPTFYAVAVQDLGDTWDEYSENDDDCSGSNTNTGISCEDFDIDENGDGDVYDSHENDNYINNNDYRGDVV